MSHSNEQTLRTIYDALAKGDVSTITGLLTDDIKFHISGRSPVSGQYSGKEEVLGFIRQLMERSGGSFSVEVLDILANDHHGVALTMESGERQGKSLQNRAAHVWEMQDGKCTIFRGYNQNAWDDFWS